MDGCFPDTEKSSSHDVISYVESKLMHEVLIEKRQIRQT